MSKSKLQSTASMTEEEGIKVITKELGTLDELKQVRYNEDLYRWEAKMDFEGNEISVSFSFEDSDLLSDPGKLVLVYRELCPQISGIIKEARAKTANSELLQLYSEWNEGKEVTPAEFSSRLRIESIEINETLWGTMYFEDGGMFADHMIEVFIDKGKYKDASLIG